MTAKEYAQKHLASEIKEIIGSARARNHPELTFHEKALIYKYSSPEGYLEVNTKLRLNKGKNTTTFGRLLESALKKLPDYNGLVYRKVKLTKAQISRYKTAAKRGSPLREVEGRIGNNYNGGILVMALKDKIAFVNKVNKTETTEVLSVIADSILIRSSDNSNRPLKKISGFISVFSNVLESAVKNDLIKSKQKRLMVIKYLDKLHQQKEAIDIADNSQKFQVAAERIGRKMQSGFSSPPSEK